MVRVFVEFETDIDGFFDVEDDEKIEAIKVILESGAEAMNTDITIREIRFEDEENADD